jgi:hypothetical protein
VWWFSLGIVCGAVAVVSILLRELTRSQEDATLGIGIVFWVLGGTVCWASNAVQRHERPSAPHRETASLPRPIADAMPDVLERQWQRYAVREVVLRLHVHHL